MGMGERDNASSRLPPSPSDVFERSEVEGRERLERSPVAQASTGFTAGFNIVFAIVALGITHHLISERFGASTGQLAGALAFGIGLTFLVVGRSELFTENFLDPLSARAAPVERFASKLTRLWSLSLVFNLAGGAVLALILTTQNALPEGGPGALVEVAERMARRDAWADFMNAIAGGALVTLLTWLVLCVESGFGRFAVACVHCELATWAVVGPAACSLEARRHNASDGTQHEPSRRRVEPPHASCARRDGP
jgi:formate/nitrite transporter FocA (FNT family)